MFTKTPSSASYKSARGSAWAMALTGVLTLAASQTAAALDIIVDNASGSTSSIGQWKLQGARDVYGADAANSSSAGASFAFNLQLPESGLYEVYMWWPSNRKNSSAVPVTVEHAGGSYQTMVDQRSGGSWRRLGSWDFSTAGRITLASTGKGAVSADAVKLVALFEPTPIDPVVSLPPPVEPVPTEPTPTPIVGSATLTWLAPSTNSDGSPITDLAGYVVYMSNQGGSYTMNDIVARVPATVPTGGTQEFYQIDNLAQGTYYFAITAYNNAGAESSWSTQVSKSIGN